MLWAFEKENVKGIASNSYGAWEVKFSKWKSAEQTLFRSLSSCVLIGMAAYHQHQQFLLRDSRYSFVWDFPLYWLWDGDEVENTVGFSCGYVCNYWSRKNLASRWPPHWSMKSLKQPTADLMINLLEPCRSRGGPVRHDAFKVSTKRHHRSSPWNQLCVKIGVQEWLCTHA